MRHYIIGLCVLALSLALVLCLVEPVAADQVTFREGAAGYAGTQDTYVDAGSVNSAFGAASSLNIDASPLRQGLVRFDNIIGNGAGQIPPGAIINSATLTLEITNRTNSSATLSFHRMLAAWDENSTWNSLSNGIQTDDVEAVAVAEVTVSGLSSTGAVVINGFEAAVQAWANGSTNHGWVLILDSTNGLAFLSSESSSTTLRPLLTVDFTPVGNTAPFVVSAIPDTSVVENSAPVSKYRDLNEVFYDAQQGTALIFAELNNSNPGLVTTVFDADSAIGFQFAPNQSGTATITIRAYDAELLFADDTFTVTVIPLVDIPMIVSEIPDTNVLVDNPPIQNYRDLNDVFYDNADGSALTFTIESNSKPSVVTVVIDADSALDISFAPGGTGLATIVVRATDSQGYWREDMFDVLVTAGASGIGDGQTPSGNRLLQNHPNPFNPATTIDYEIETAGVVALRVYDVNGQRIRTLFEGMRTPGRWSVDWDGRDAAGRRVASGVYFCRLEERGAAQARKMILLK